MEYYFDDRQDTLELTDELCEMIKSVVEASIEDEGLEPVFDLSISLVNNEEIREINRDFRGIDKPTDVLSFPLIEDFDDESVELEEMSLGDIVISTERAREQSIEYNHSLEREICYLICHSMFHLLGYDHMSTDEAAIMRAKEEKVLQGLGITREM